jgi:hypothetical protein
MSSRKGGGSGTYGTLETSHRDGIRDYQARASWERSVHTSRKGHNLRGEDEKVLMKLEVAQVVDTQLPCRTRDVESQSGTDYSLSPKGDGTDCWRAK